MSSEEQAAEAAEQIQRERIRTALRRTTQMQALGAQVHSLLFGTHILHIKRYILRTLLHIEHEIIRTLSI